MTITANGNRMTTEIARQSRLAQNIARTQVSISTGKRIQTPSDDPAAAARVATIARAQADDAVWNGNLTLAAGLAAQADGVLATLAAHVALARQHVIAGASGTVTAADRATYAAQLRGIADDVAVLRNTRSALGQPLFAIDAPAAIRVAQSNVLAPVDSAAAIFERGGAALVQDLSDAAAALDSGDSARVAAANDRLGGWIDHVANAQGNQGVQAARIDLLIDSNQARGVELASERSGLEDTDLSAAIAQLNTQQLTLQAAQAAFARINRQSLFEILG